MHQAELFPGIANFLHRCKRLDAKVFIVSHKTEFGHHDQENIPLRDAALEWMKVNKFFDEGIFNISEKSVYFSNTREEKVKKISTLKLDVFVDDLIEVFKEPCFPLHVKKIYFSKAFDIIKSNKFDFCYNNWSQISDEILGEVNIEDYLYWAQIIFENKITNISDIDGRGNSKIHQLTTDDGKIFALKAYPDRLIDPRNRIQAEFNACQFLESTNRAQKAIDMDSNLNMAVYEWVDGSVIQKIERRHIDDALTFIALLAGKSKNLNSKDFPLASEACLSLNMLSDQIHSRFSRLKARAPHFDKLKLFLELSFEPVWAKAIKWTKNYWPKNNIDSILDEKFHTISPSDFGFHNALERKDGTLCYLDLEYFGFDDPAKLIIDFIWHPGMDLSSDQKKTWIKESSKIFNETENLQSRLFAAWPVIGLRWSLILLNEFLVEGWNKRVHAKNVIKELYIEKLENQLNKASAICNFISSNSMQCPYV